MRTAFRHAAASRDSSTPVAVDVDAASGKLAIRSTPTAYTSLPVRSDSFFETASTAFHVSLGGARASERAVVSFDKRVRREVRSDNVVTDVGEGLDMPASARSLTEAGIGTVEEEARFAQLDSSSTASVERPARA